jgi:D-alanine-D-alanine ligase
MSIDVHPDWWKSLFDEIYLLTDARTVDDDNLTRREVDMLCTLLPLRKNDRILDLCGGQGRHSIELAKRGFRDCTVLDYSEVLLDKGRTTADQLGCRLRFVQGDATSTGFPDASYDYVMILGNSLGYLPDHRDDLKILLEARRLLRTGGWLLLDVTDGAAVRDRFTPNAWHEIADDIVVCRQRVLDEATIRCREVVICKVKGLLRDQTYAIRTYGAEHLEHLVSEAGFSEISRQKGFASNQLEGDYGFMNHRLLVKGRKKA